MRYWFCLLLILSISAMVFAQPGKGKKPKIRGQKPISTNEEVAVTIQLTDLEVRDPENLFYPWGFTLKVYEGSNYTISNATVTPAVNFNGTLSVPVTVNDGKNESDKFNLQIQVRSINDPPVITGQTSISTNEDLVFTIQLSHLVISDPDDNQFTLAAVQGTNYTLSGLTVTPSLNFSGTLTIPVSVNDGEAVSTTYNLQLTVTPVNDAPAITGQLPIETEENKPFAILLSQLTVTDPDNTYPTGFTLIILPSADNTYTVSANQVTSSFNFEGMLSITVRVNDGSVSSDPYILNVKVSPGKNGPTITGQVPVSINEDQPIAIQLSHLTVSDPDNTNYPTGFTLRILSGANYSASGNTVTPQANYNGNLTVNVVVSDGSTESNTFGLVIGIRPINDAPVISKFETEALAYQPGKAAVSISTLFEVTDVDNDSLTQAEISFKSDTYRLGMDELSFENTGGIKGTFDKQREVLLLSGRAPLAEYIKAVRAVKYNFLTGIDLPFETKTISIIVSDGKLASEKVERQIKAAHITINLDIPTAFTPNGDSANDTWSIKPIKKTDELINAIVRIYNKKGLLLFEAESLEKPWDGRLNGELLPADTYYYTIDLDLQNSRALFKGLVTILR